MAHGAFTPVFLTRTLLRPAFDSFLSSLFRRAASHWHGLQDHPRLRNPETRNLIYNSDQYY